MQSTAAIQNMQMKSDVLKSLTPDDKQAEEEVVKARNKLESIREQLEQARYVCVIIFRGNVHRDQLSFNIDCLVAVTM